MARKDKSLEAQARERTRLFEETVLPGFDLPKGEIVIPRCNGEGKKAERIIGAILGIAGYHTREQQRIGRAHGSDVIADYICMLPWSLDQGVVISVKYQRSSGSWDEKVPAEVAKLDLLLPRKDTLRAWVVLIGTGIGREKYRRWTNGFIDTKTVHVSSLDRFIEKALVNKL